MSLFRGQSTGFVIRIKIIPLYFKAPVKKKKGLNKR